MMDFTEKEIDSADSRGGFRCGIFGAIGVRGFEIVHLGGRSLALRAPLRETLSSPALSFFETLTAIHVKNTQYVRSIAG